MVKPSEARKNADVDEFELDQATLAMVQNLPSRRFLLWVLSRCGIYGVNMSGNSSIHVTEGQRYIGRQILDQLNKVDPTLYPTIQLEEAKVELARRSIGKDKSKHVSESLEE